MASIIKQLVASPYRETGEILVKDVIKFGKAHNGGSPSLEDYLDLFSRVVGALERSVVIIDALDECAERDSKGYKREWLVNTLLEFDLQLLVTSRDLPVIEELFNAAPSFGKIPIYPDPYDIASYIRWKIYDKKYGSPKKLRDVIEKRPFLLEEITNVVTEKYAQM
jgi:hypothetical protein